MKPEKGYRNHLRTAYILLDTKKCTACWKCLEKCTNNVIGKINLPWHKHARIVKADSCTGCLKCVNVCKPLAFSKVTI
jgi:Pyruvate/2-oxoacid:ferredoxin oxidoreductase delta subunit